MILTKNAWLMTLFVSPLMSLTLWLQLQVQGRVSQVYGHINILEWWVNNENIPPNWAVAYKKIVLCQPSSPRNFFQYSEKFV